MSATKVRHGQTGPYTPLAAHDGVINGANRLAFYSTPTANVTFEFNNVGDGCTFSLLLNMPDPVVVITWPETVIWPGGFEPNLGAGEQMVLLFLKVGGNFYGRPALPYTKTIFPEEPTGDIDGVNTTFELSNEPVTGFHMGFLNGIKLTPGAGNDYTLSGTTVTMAAAPESGDRLEFCYLTNGNASVGGSNLAADANPFYISMVS